MGDTPETSVLDTLISSVTTIIGSFLDWFSEVATSLIANPMIALMFGLGIALLMYKLVVRLVGKASFRKSGRRR